MIDRAASRDAPVVLQGEAGVGKQVFARVLHARHRRHAKPFVVIACHGIAEEPLACELFGSGGKPFSTFGQTGCIETAAGGTLFFNDVGDLPTSIQTKLLRLLREQRIVRVGESHAATSQCANCGRVAA